MGRSLEERPLLPCGKEMLGKGGYEATAQLNELAVNPVRDVSIEQSAQS